MYIHGQGGYSALDVAEHNSKDTVKHGATYVLPGRTRRENFRDEALSNPAVWFYKMTGG